jgi:hypothetical protein
MQHRPDFPLDGILLAEAVRSLEEAAGTLDGAADAAAAACAKGGSFETRIIRRAYGLPAAQSLLAALAHLRGATMLAVVITSVLALAGGGTAAHALLTTANATINVYLSLITLLALPILTLLVWLLLVAMTSGRMAAGIVGRGVLALAGRLARWLDTGTTQLAMVRAAARVSAESGAARWLASALSHLLWLAYLLGVLVVLLLHFSTREYAFSWETTILAERHYQAATEVLAVLPGWLGFPVPDASMVAESRQSSVTMATATSHAWAGLVLGCIVVYGILPRAVALLFSALAARRAVGRIRLDTSHLGFARLRPLLMPAARSVGIVDPERPDDTERVVDTAESPPLGRDGPVALIGLEIDRPASGWPPSVRGIEWQDLGFVNDRTDRQRALDGLAEGIPTPRAVLIACALTVTPDRGHLAFFRDLKRQARLALVILLTGGQRLRARGHPQTLATRVDDWRRLALAAGVPEERVIEVDLDHLTDASARRLARRLGADPGALAEDDGGHPVIGEAFDTIADHARRWQDVPDERQRLALHQAIAALYRNRLSHWPGALRLTLEDGVPDAQSLSAAAERVVALLPARLRISPRWLSAGALAGALGCLATATLAAPVALAALPAWTGLGAALAAVLERATTGETAATAEGRDIGEPVAAAAMFALILHLQGREEATITDLLDRTLGDDDVPRLADASAARAWLDATRERLDRALPASPLHAAGAPP